MAKDRSGAVEALRVLRTTRKTAIKCRRAALQQLHNTIVAAPEEVRDQVRNLTRMQRLRTCAAWRPDTVDLREDMPHGLRQQLRASILFWLAIGLLLIAYTVSAKFARFSYSSTLVHVCTTYVSFIPTTIQVARLCRAAC